MAKLSSAVVQQRVASLRDVEEALARQVLYGGDLVTNLLQQTSGLDETVLTRLLAESLDLEPAPAGELPPASAEARQRVSAELARRHGLYPLGLSGATLSVAVSARLADDVVQELGAALGVELVQQAAPLVRIRQAISRDYAQPLDRRTERIIAKIEGRPDPNPSVQPAPLQDAPDISSLPRPPSIPPIGPPPPEGPHNGNAEPSELGNREEATPSIHEVVTAPAPEVQPRKQTTPGMPVPSAEQIEPQGERKPTLQGMTGAAPKAAPERPATTAKEAPPARRATAPNAASEPPATAAKEGPPARPAAERQDAPATRVAERSRQPPGLASWGASQKEAGRKRQRHRHRGPYTPAQAEEDLMGAEDRDGVLGAFFDFAAQYFEYSALFAVHGDLAEGRDAQGPGANRDEVAGIGVPLELPSALSKARDSLSWSLTTLQTTALDGTLAADLRRKPDNKVLLLPVAVRGRCVLIFYGDDGDNDIELSEVGDVIAFAPLVASALENMILRRKAAARRAAAGPSAPAGRAPILSRPPRSQLPPVEARAETLARVIGAPSSAPPPAGAAQGARTPAPAPVPATKPAATPPPKPVTSGAPPKPVTSGAPPKPATSGSPPKPVTSGPPPKPATSGPSPKPGGPDATWRKHTPAGPPSSIPPPRGMAASAPPKPHSSPASSSAAHRSPPPKPKRTVTPPQGTPVFPLTRRSEDTDEGDQPPEDGWHAPSSGGVRSGTSSPSIEVGTAEIDDDWATEGFDAESGLPNHRSVAVEATAPHRRHASEELGLPKVIVDVERDVDKLLKKLYEGDESAVEQLAALGTEGVTNLVADFPGPIRSEPDRIGTHPRASECGPVLKALARIGAAAVPFVVVRTHDADPKIRAWATRLLGEIPLGESAQAVMRRLADKDWGVRRAARDAGRLLFANDELRTLLCDNACAQANDASQKPEQRIAALEALADWREARSVPILITLAAEHTEVGRSAHWALRIITRQDFGSDRAAWNEWHDEHKDQHRVQWLIDALMHEEQTIRRDASEELKTLTKEYFGYYEDLSPSERAAAQKRYREWWESVGKARFARGQ